MNLNNLEKKLESAYRRKYSSQGNPSGMFNVKPPIPFVGNIYGVTTPRIISYASAENLGYAFDSNLKPESNERIHTSNYNQYTRARDFYCDHMREYFPYIHCSPFNNGSQLFLTRNILNILGHDTLFSNHPFGFIEQISAGNFGKFSIASGANQDYAGSASNIKHSLDYIQEDFNILKPEIIILPRTIFNTMDRIKKWDAILNQAKMHSATFIKIYQLTFFNNSRVKNEANNYPDARSRRNGYFEWINEIEGNVDIHSHMKWINNCIDIQHI